MLRTLFFLFLLGFVFSCEKKETDTPDPVVENSLYFPPIDSDAWATVSPASLNWDEAKLNELYDFLQDNNTRAFIILKEGKIAVEKYWGNNILNTASFDQNTNWYWASAGKTLTAFLVGLAQEKGLLDIQDKTSDYLGPNWTSLPPEKENLINIRHQLTMTTGLDYHVPDIFCTDPECLQYGQDAGTQWFYHNAPYTLLEQVVSNAAGVPYNQFTDTELESQTGMSGQWIRSGFNNLYWSTARDAARFGLLILNKGQWKDTPVMTDIDYYNAMITPSQDLNPSYGYLWWLNGKGSAILPGLSAPVFTDLAPSAPSDLFAAMGKNGQVIDVVPSQDLVLVRMGEAPGEGLISIQFHDEMWEILGQIIPQ
jgi:CubicO group peptidase (beta-lactamase class C family)